MNLDGFNIARDCIAFEFGERCFELHNCFDFVGLKYDVEARVIEFYWKKNSGPWVPGDDPQAIKLTVDGVTMFKVKERDSETQFTDDNCLSGIGFLYDCDLEDMDCMAAHATPDERRSHLSLVFESGLSVKVAGETAKLNIDE